MSSGKILPSNKEAEGGTDQPTFLILILLLDSVAIVYNHSRLIYHPLERWLVACDCYHQHDPTPHEHMID